MALRNGKKVPNGSAHELAVAAYAEKRGPALRRKGATDRDGKRAKRAPSRQIALLDSRLGKGQGAERERARLRRQVARAQAADTRVARTIGGRLTPTRRRLLTYAVLGSA